MRPAIVRDAHRRAGLATALLLACAPALAQDGVAALAEDIAEGSRFLLSAELGATYTDNFFNQPETGLQQEAFGAVLMPAVGYSFAVPRFRFGTVLQGEIATFDVPSSIDDYEDAAFRMTLDWLSAARHRFGYALDLQFDHDPFGSDRTESSPFQNRELDRWTGFANQVRYRYGLPTAPINLELRGDIRKREYTSNRDDACFNAANDTVGCDSPAATRVVLGARFLDWESAAGQATLLYNISNKSALLADVVLSQQTFENHAVGTVIRDGRELRYRVGARWLATARTSGDVRVGMVQRSSEDPRREDFESVDWQANVGWTPLSYMQFNLQTGRRSLESYLGDTEFIDSEYHGVDWTWNWTPRFQTKTHVTYTHLDFVGSDSQPGNPADSRTREDKIWWYGLEALYRIARPLTLVARTDFSSRDSNFDGDPADGSSQIERDYDRFNAYVGVRYTR